MEGKVQMTTVMLHVKNLILDGEQAIATLVRPIDKLHVENIKTLMFSHPAGFSAPFLLMVDPKDCPTKDDWNTDPEIHKKWKYVVVGGNHGARAKKDLFDTYGKQIFAQVEAWVFAGLTQKQMRILAYQHNIDQEYRKTMSNVDKIRACHALFRESQFIRSKELKFRCCDELQLEYNPQNRDSLSKHDPMFQIAFRTGELWDLQEKIFDMWQRFETVGQRKVVSPPPKKSAKSKPPNKTAKTIKKVSGDLNLGHWRGLQGINNDDQVKRLLMRVVNRVLSLEQMFHEAEKIKKIVKVRNLFLQISGQLTWDACRKMFPDETDGLRLASWAEKLADQVRISHSSYQVFLSRVQQGM